MREAGIREDSYLTGLGASSGQLIQAHAWEGLQVHRAAECSGSALVCQKSDTSEAHTRPTEVRKSEVCLPCAPQHWHTDLLGILGNITPTSRTGF